MNIALQQVGNPEAAQPRSLPVISLSRPVRIVQDLESFKRQESIFVLLNLLVLAVVLLFHTLFSSLLGEPSVALVVILGIAFLMRTFELVWVQARSTSLSPTAIKGLTLCSVAANLALAILLAFLTHRQDSPYWVLMVMPVVESAFRFSLVSTVFVALAGASLNLFWVRHFAVFHPPVAVGEYFEAATIGLICLLIGVLFWMLVNQLRDEQERRAANLEQLRQTREKLLTEEKLGAVGRFASAVAHEIRNPVAMISSSLATATNGCTNEADREEMFTIAAKEASRLEKLTTDFLRYARPSEPTRCECSVSEVIGYVADISRARAKEKGVLISQVVPEDLFASIDIGQIQQALLNLVMNAVDAALQGSAIVLRVDGTEDSSVRLEVENQGEPIPAATAERIFEPFFTTKPTGTGLGLAIARNIARAHGGDLSLTFNQDGRIRFTLTVPVGLQKDMGEING